VEQVATELSGGALLIKALIVAASTRTLVRIVSSPPTPARIIATAAF
jgi:hypothetical protein